MMRQNLPIIWVDWGQHLRSRTLARRLAVELFEICVGGNRIRRYLGSIIRTIAIIRKSRPEVVIATNPSIVLGFLLLTVRRWWDFALVSDAHYLGVRATRGYRVLQWLLDFYNSRADLVIVTNVGHANYLASHGCHTSVCADPLPQLAMQAAVSVPPKSVFLVCSFDEDEPYAAAFAAFAHLRESEYVLFVSGNYTKARIDPAQFPWIHFLGFVSDDDYYSYLQSCSIVMDLTTLEDCLLCGAYEALSAGKPLVISRTRAISEYFGSATVLTDNTPTEIAENVALAYSQRHELSRKVADWVVANEIYMSNQISALKARLYALRGLALEGPHGQATS